MVNRRRFLTSAAVAASAAWFGIGRGPVYGQTLGSPAEPGSEARVALTLVPAERPTAIPAFNGTPLPLWTFSDDTWLPIVRVPLGARLEVDLHNQLPREGEQASIHWHGIRVPNDQDGVPYLVQPPVMPGESYHYSFVPPDTGTFFFHTHCNTAEHIGRGLVGVLIVEGDETAPYDADEIVLIRDWRVDLDAGTFLPFTTSRGAGRAGSYGTVRTVNGMAAPEIALPAAADCRLRLINVDPTRIVELALEGADAAIVALDGIAVSPIAFERWVLGPAMRCDVVVRTPADGGVIRLIDYRTEPPLELASFRAGGADLRTGPFDPAPLRSGIIPVPDLTAAEAIRLDFASSGSADLLAADDAALGFLGPICLSFNQFWTINDAGWPGDGHSAIPAPLAQLDVGRPYRFVLSNKTQLFHPIHFHGHSFLVVRSDQRALPVHYADTVLLMPNETVEIAFVADNPGKWMVHCHIAEHQETGMMGYFIIA